MPRIRSMKPDIWDDEAMGEVSRDARLLFCGLITQADDDGRLSANARWLISKVYPYDVDQITPTQLEVWLEELHTADLAWIYEVDQRSYVWLCGWESHQSIDKRYYKESKLPPPPDERPPRARRAPEERTTPDRIGEEGIGEDSKADALDALSPSTPPAPSLRAVEERSVVELSTGGRLSGLLADLIAQNGSRRPRIGDGWLTAERLLVERDKRDPSEAERLIRWCQTDEFWRANVLSMPTFRQKYDQLRLQAQRGNGKADRVAKLVQDGHAVRAGA